MVIIVGNQKGGTGRTTLAWLLCGFLAREKNMGVSLIDMDYQQSLQRKLLMNRLLENDEEFSVLSITAENFPATVNPLLFRLNHVVIVDLPAKLDDEHLLDVFRSADLVICPFNYDQANYEPTIFFSLLLKNINPEAEIAYLPNRVKAGCRYESYQEINQQLASFGLVLPSLPERIDFQRISSVYIPASVNALAGTVFQLVWRNYIDLPPNNQHVQNASIKEKIPDLGGEFYSAV